MTAKTILITGASRGIGRALALRYAEPGAHLILIAKDLDKLRDVAQVCEQQGASTIIESIDVRDASHLSTFILEKDAQAPIDLVIANAGVSASLNKDWRQESLQAIEQIFAINLQGTINTINPIMHNMIARKSGQLVIMSSMAGLRGLPHSPSYCASKAATYIYGQSLRAWLSRYQVKVNVVCPGFVKTDMSDRLDGPKPFLMSGEKAAKIIQKGLLKNKGCIAFPWPLMFAVKLGSFLPTGFVDLILNRVESYVHPE